MLLNRIVAVVTLIICFSSMAYADDPASNVRYSETDRDNLCVVEATPYNHFGSTGRTKIYSHLNPLLPIETYRWYSPSVHIICERLSGSGPLGSTLVRMGHWPAGHKANADTLAIAFYQNGMEVGWYSTLDIAGGDQANVSCSVSHYMVVKNIEGFVWNEDGDLLFRLLTVDGRRLTFDPKSGELISSESGADSDEILGACAI